MTIVAAANAVAVPGSTRFRKHEHESSHVCVVLDGGFLERDRRSWRDVGPGTVRISGATRHDIDFGREGASCLVMEVEFDTSTLPRPEFIERDERLIRLADGISRLSKMHDPISAIRKDDLATEFLAQVDRRLRGHAGPPPPWLVRARQLLHDSNGAASVTDIAREAGVHRVHVARTFRDHYGMSVTAYARKLRVHAALTMLATSSLPLSRLALESGYADQSHFTREIRAAVGATPRVVRESLNPRVPPGSGIHRNSGRGNR
ncbi:MAG TPA: helix-turn-helix domain-containing protein [Gemmatimonadaceae bacterium]|nr:helix-turn-helix domain-containing protein [Gemmatimonadaceae bacterium]